MSNSLGILEQEARIEHFRKMNFTHEGRAVFVCEDLGPEDIRDFLGDHEEIFGFTPILLFGWDIEDAIISGESIKDTLHTLEIDTGNKDLYTLTLNESGYTIVSYSRIPDDRLPHVNTDTGTSVAQLQWKRGTSIELRTRSVVQSFHDRVSHYVK